MQLHVDLVWRCASPKLRPAVKSTVCTTSSTRQFVRTVPYVPLSLPVVGSNRHGFSIPTTLLVENLALRQQLSVLKRRNRRPKLAALDKLFWVVAHRFWSGWKKSLLIVAPETVIRWHRGGFRLYRSLISKIRKRVGRRRISREVRDLIFRTVAENPTWGAPRIHGELLLIGFDVSERSVSRSMKRAPRDPERNHCEGIAAMNFFTVPTVTFQLLYGFFIIKHRPAADCSL